MAEYLEQNLVFPSFSEGLSLRRPPPQGYALPPAFPFLFGGAFIEADTLSCQRLQQTRFPFLFGGAFIEASSMEGGSLGNNFSLPFRRGFH